LALSERLDMADYETKYKAAERWQYEQALATWEEDQRTGGRDRVEWEEIERMFAAAIAKIKAKNTKKKRSAR
jgi:hypothetical protein